MKTPIYIFDLDVVVRVDGKPNKPVINTINCLLDGGARVYIWSVRSQVLRAETNRWIVKHLCYPRVYLRVRADCDHRSNQSLKKSWMDALSDEKKKRLVAVFEARDKVVAMWRDAGIACFKVA